MVCLYVCIYVSVSVCNVVYGVGCYFNGSKISNGENANSYSLYVIGVY